MLTRNPSQNRNRPTKLNGSRIFCGNLFANRTDECFRPHASCCFTNHVTASALDYSCNLAAWLPPHVGSLQMICFF